MNDILFEPVLHKEDSHPLILFVDELNRYWYLKCTNKSDENHNQKPSLSNEVLIKKSKDNNLFYDDNYINTSHIYWIDKNEFDHFVNKYQIRFISAKNLSDENIDLIYLNILDKFISIPSSIKITIIHIEDYKQLYSQWRYNELYCYQDELDNIFGFISNHYDEILYERDNNLKL